MRSRPITLLLCLLLAGCLPTDPVPMGTLRVHVVDEAGNPVRGALVEPVGGWHWADRRAVAYTDRKGATKFSLPFTTYTVYAWPPTGYRHRDLAFPVTHAEVAVTGEPVSVLLVFAK